MSNSYKEPFTPITEAELIKVFEKTFKDSKDIFPEYYYTHNNVKMVKIDGVSMRAYDFDKAMREVLKSDFLSFEESKQIDPSTIHYTTQTGLSNSDPHVY